MCIGPIALRAAPAAVALAMVLPGGAARAHDQDSVRAEVAPASAAPGATVEVSVSGCEGTTGSAGSGAFEEDAALTGPGDGPRTLTGGARIRQGLTGTFELTVICDGHPHQGVGKVGVADHDPAPEAPAKAGGGGAGRIAAHTSDDADDASEAGPGTLHAVVGLVLAGAAAVAVAFRSVRRRRPE
ncbi:hypothetical protein [Streptomyces sp. NRRL S-1521]|uniref:hypothetical protein n=1 Tax=Streptomyces sp. NRRL S-1521 TaxID=1609100 RepID=UPI00074989F9|nr:hypothetical protein [Streptomyces sp. NRRL S-1521]KUL52169.1 hypothetical protein ADL30_24705 [Streptomyces sp. NRRL S-1521]